MWSEIIYNAGPGKEREQLREITDYRELLTLPLARTLYDDIRKLNDRLNLSVSLNSDFGSLTHEQKSFWYDFADTIPMKFSGLGLFIRPFDDFCRTCIITDQEIATMVRADLVRYCPLAAPGTAGYIVQQEAGHETRSFYGTVSDWNRFSLELNYLIPAQIKKCGFEIIRQEEAEEIKMPFILKLARAIHSKYLRELRTQKTNGHPDHYGLFTNIPDGDGHPLTMEFDDLPDDIRYSNADNALHIPTKLLSVGYRIRLVRKGFKPFTLRLNSDEIETMSIVEHIRWSWDKRLNGWTYGDTRDDKARTHPGLRPYHELPEPEKEKDRELVRLIPSLLNDINFEAIPVDKRHIRHLPYILKPQSVIHKILNETRLLNDQIRELVSLSPSIEEMVNARNRKIEEAIREIEASYNYAQHIQETFLPDDLFIRECFPESFILFKPRDIVSGDFYFFSRRDNKVIFAVADCTGHGIPGALLSTLGYGILDQAVNEVRLTDPSSILSHLYSRIHRFLRGNAMNAGIADDMDLILCILDINTNILTYAGVRIPLYHISGDNLNEYRAGNNSAGSYTGEEGIFVSENIRMKPGDTIYLCSDGFIDQFGGRHHKRYQSGRFRLLLTNIRNLSMPEQGDILFEEIEKWRDENHEEQTDDILVIGIRI